MRKYRTIWKQQGEEHQTSSSRNQCGRELFKMSFPFSFPHPPFIKLFNNPQGSWKT